MPGHCSGPEPDEDSASVKSVDTLEAIQDPRWHMIDEELEAEAMSKGKDKEHMHQASIEGFTTKPPAEPPPNCLSGRIIGGLGSLITSPFPDSSVTGSKRKRAASSSYQASLHRL